MSVNIQMFDMQHIIVIIVEKCERWAIKQMTLLGLEVQIRWMLIRGIVHQGS